MLEHINFLHIAMLVCSGVIVGFINTLAGGASTISLNVFMFMGLTPLHASIANRIPVLFQTLTSSVIFYRNKMLDIKKSLIYTAPLLVGAIFGAIVAVEVDREYFNYALALMLVIVVFFLLYKPNRWIKSKAVAELKSLNFVNGTVFFLMGLYAGFIYVGMGYFLIITLVLLIGYDLVKANANKNFIVLLYTPVLLLVFSLKGEFNLPMLVFASIHAIGNIVGASIAAKVAITKDANFIRYVMVVVSILTALQIFRIIKMY
ncbi:MAG: sulfite exporter TauE/SafE family protein [Bacteroidales bacterium]|jgi:uncharacterized membrane protein YfcA|nr:sulfite exporter TauE/SafE family protein [Bacteroidales bacterium]